MKKYIAVLFLSIPSLLFAQNYNAASIPDSLTKNANAVKRFEELKVIIKSPSRAIVRHKCAITILNEEGRRFANYVNSYAKLHWINSIDGTLYDAAGKELKSVKKKDISDVSYNDEMSLMTDARLKQHSFYYSNYPYTVEYEDEEEYDGVIGLPNWMPVETEKLSVQQSRFVVEAPVDYQVRFKQICYSNKPVVTPGSKTTVYQWEVNNIAAIKRELFSPDWDEITTNVFIAPTKFQYGGYEGDMSSWQGLGKYISGLYEGRDVLPDNVKADVHRIADNISNKKEKIEALYQYLQNNTRYISIQLGIGGLQPFEAKEVAAKKYGDCKALSNFMVSILKEAGIKANPVIITAGDGERGLWEDFSANYFNHVVVCVPDKDTTWLECTSQTTSAGYMGSFTGNRKALLLGDDGGHVVATPFYNKEDNLQVRKINAVINTEGALSVDVSTHFTGQQQEMLHSLIHDATAQQREKFLNEAINLATYKIEKSDYKEQKGRVPAVDEYLKISAPNYASVSGKRLFIVPNIFNKGGSKLSTDEPRRFDIKFDYPYRDVDTIHITIPDGYQAEVLPKDVLLESKFGKYSINFKVNGNSVDVVRISEANAGVFPPSDYNALAKFFEDKYKADRVKLVLVKKEG
jgi:hypothetical protein